MSSTVRIVLIGLVALSSLTTAAKNSAPFAIAIHGGAGTIRQADLTPKLEHKYRSKLREAVTAGHLVLRNGGSSVKAVVASIEILESSPLFNAGVGAVLTYNRVHELDASIMNGDTLQAGAVTGVKVVKHPIRAALSVMTISEHVMLSGRGADEFAKLQGLATVENSFFTTQRRLDELNRRIPKISKFGTVGAVALDQYGNLAAGTSTGGRTAKRYGRIGDTPIIGAGTYADNRSCAVSATGHGEYFIRYHVAADICSKVRYLNVSIKDAAQQMIFEELEPVGGKGGVIVMDPKGNIANVFNTRGMYRASIDPESQLAVSIFRDK